MHLNATKILLRENLEKRRIEKNLNKGMDIKFYYKKTIKKMEE